MITSLPAKPMMVVLSGGQDSATALFMAVKANMGTGKPVHAISFDYGQRHQQEIEMAKALAARVAVPHKVVSIDWYRQLTNNALLDHNMKIDREDGKLPNTFVDGRNAMFLLAAAIYAKGMGIYDLVTGVSEADYSGYPDCRQSFIESMQSTIQLAMDCEFHIHTPFIKASKVEEWRLADQLGVFDIIRNHTLTCYEGVIGDGCGKCPACQLRLRAMHQYLEEKAKGTHHEHC